ncbi:MAG: hypothetical protein LBF15_01695 [Candidatus Peribacteria bacterium]|nr:hypothetical protein [Candidatus Peribacteria bacterium]
MGWVVALACYPPFNASTEKIFTWWSQNFPTFANAYVHITMNSLILISFTIYARASVALGLKASNLTNR